MSAATPTGVGSVEVVRADRRKAVPLAFGSLVLVVAGIYLVVAHTQHGSVPVGIAALVVFGASLVVSVVIFVTRPIVVVFGNAGIAVPTSIRHRRRAPLLPWSAIESLEVYSYWLGGGQQMIGLVPEEPADPLWTSRRLFRLNRRLTGLPVSFTMSLVAGGPEDIARRMRRYRPSLPLAYRNARHGNGELIGGRRRWPRQ